MLHVLFDSKFNIFEMIALVGWNTKKIFYYFNFRGLMNKWSLPVAFPHHSLLTEVRWLYGDQLHITAPCKSSLWLAWLMFVLQWEFARALTHNNSTNTVISPSQESAVMKMTLVACELGRCGHHGNRLNDKPIVVDLCDSTSLWGSSPVGSES